MTFDKPEHKDLVLKLINSSQFNGSLIDILYELKIAVTNSNIITNNNIKQTDEILIEKQQ